LTSKDPTFLFISAETVARELISLLTRIQLTAYASLRCCKLKCLPVLASSYIAVMLEYNFSYSCFLSSFNWASIGHWNKPHYTESVCSGWKW